MLDFKAAEYATSTVSSTRLDRLRRDEIGERRPYSAKSERGYRPDS
jgi:hypothetical protein